MANTAYKIEIRYYEAGLRLQVQVRLYPCDFDRESIYGKELEKWNKKTSYADKLVDIRSVSVNKELPREERIAEFVRQIKNPCHFRCGKFIVRATYCTDGAALEECLHGILR